ncbi:MAG: hypothetical protein ACUVRV_04910 [Cyanobacteriota bacterium]
MSYSEEARQRIIDYLKPKPINHGQVHLSQVVIPDAFAKSLDQSKVEVAVESLKRFGNSNLYPVIIRRTDLYGEGREYEVIFGEEWCKAANELGIEKIWVWVFDTPDDQVNDLRQFMSLGENKLIYENLFSEIRKEISKLQKQIEDKFNQVLSRLPEPPKLKNINEETKAGLASLDNPIVSKNALKIYEFIQEQKGITDLRQLKAIKGIGDKTIAYLARFYTCEKTV